MNLLAHALLAYAFLPDSEGKETCGAIMADYFLGQRTEDYPQAVARGIVHHRRVDAFTDSHPAFLKARETLFAEAPPHSGGILVDLFWDNLLASNWDEFGATVCGMDLENFSREIYRRLEQSKSTRSPVFAEVAPWIISMDWFGAYANEDGIDRTLRALSSRLPHGKPLADCARLLRPNKPILERELRLFWPELLVFAEKAAHDAIARGAPSG